MTEDEALKKVDFYSPRFEAGPIYLRDWFAGQALPAVIEKLYGSGINCEQESYRIADTMMEARNWLKRR